MMENHQCILSAKNITKKFGGVTALNNVSIDIRQGEVLCIAGTNGCGKSTLIKILSGVEQADSGEIIIEGKRHQNVGILEAIRKGIQVIFQDMSIFPNLTVAENICISDRIASGQKIMSRRNERLKAKKILSELQVKIDLDQELKNLSVADRQIVAIARALCRDVKVLFMDEPTTALTWKEVKNLFRVVEQLKSAGVAVVFVSHKSEEVFDVSDRIVVMRNGTVVSDGAVDSYNSHSLMEALLGYIADEERRIVAVAPDALNALEIRELSADRLFDNISFKVRKGEIVGITGLLGSGRSEVAEAIFGRIKIHSGDILVDGHVVSIGSPLEAVRSGIAYVPPDRLTQGVFLRQSISLNIVSAAINGFRRLLGFLQRGEIRKSVQNEISKLDIKIDSIKDPVSSLSGGNQQKVVLAKWLITHPKVLILNGPTVGVDIGAKSAIMQILRDEAARGIGVLLISDDIPEIASVCNRVLVMRRGRLVDELIKDQVNENDISKAIQEV